MRRIVGGLALVVSLVVATASAAFSAGAVWNVSAVGGPASDPGVIIAVVDTGVEPSHPAFGSRVLPAIDLVGGEGGDPNGHGTHVAGTAAGGAINCGEFTGNSSAALGVAPGSKILPVRVLDGKGEGTVSGVAQGIREAADAGADVINLSLGTDLNGLIGASGDLVGAIEYAWGKGSIPVLAAGNGGLLGSLTGSGYRDLPAIVVTAVDRDGRIASYATDVGAARWGIAAPGGAGTGRAADDIVSAYAGNTCGLLAGTSMAAPHVSGALAVLRARGLSPQEAVERVLSTATDKKPSRTYGSGILDLGAALAGVPARTSTTTAPPTTTTPPTTAAPTPTTTRPPTTTTPTTMPESTTTAPPVTTAPSTTAPPTSEVVAADLEIDTDDDGTAPVPLVAGAALICAAMWLVVSRSAVRLR